MNACVNWELTLTFKDIDQYTEFMKMFVENETDNIMATSVYVRPSEDNNPTGEKVDVTIYKCWGTNLDKYVRMIKKVEDHFGYDEDGYELDENGNRITEETEE